MKQTTGTLWIDLTMLVNWSAQLTGIQRVEYNLAKRFAEREHVRFCVFHKAERKLTEFDFAHITYKIDQLQHKDSAAAAQTEADAAGVVPLYRRVVAKAKRIIAPLLSHSSKTYLRRHYHRVGDGAQPSDSEPITFQSDDAFLILSGDWSDTTLGTMVAEMRAQTKCKVLQIVYDMLPAFYPAYYLPGTSAYFSTYMRQMFANCDGILAISEST